MIRGSADDVDRLRARARPARPGDGRPRRCGSASSPGEVLVLPVDPPDPGRARRTCAARACTSRSSPTSTAAPPASSRMEDLVEELDRRHQGRVRRRRGRDHRSPRRRRRGRRPAQPRRLRGRDRHRAARGPLRDRRRLPDGSGSAGSRRSTTAVDFAERRITVREVEGRRVGRVLVTAVPLQVMVDPEHPISIEPRARGRGHRRRRRPGRHAGALTLSGSARCGPRRRRAPGRPARRPARARCRRPRRPDGGPS